MNPKLGDVGFKAGGKSYVLNMGVNAMCCVEAETERVARGRDPAAVGESALEVVGRVATNARFSDVRLLMWGGLQRHHSGTDLDDAGDIVQAMNKVKGGKRAFEYILESLQLCSPTADDEEEANADTDPTPAPSSDGTGTPSS